MSAHYGATVEETVWKIIRTTCYQWSPFDAVSARSAWIPETFRDGDHAEGWLMLHAEFYSDTLEGQFNTYTLVEYAPVPF